LGELAHAIGAELHGDPACEIRGVAGLVEAGPGDLAFLAAAKYRKHLPDCRASAVILGRDALPECPGNALISANPHLAFARATALLFPPPPAPTGRHPRAVVEDGAHIDPSAWIGPGAVVETGARIGARVFVGPNCVLGREVEIGADSRLVASVTLCHGVVLGQRVLVHPGAVIGADGFGYAKDGERWVKVPQLGGVRIGDDVEIGANTTVDRGALQDTVLADGVKLDNLIQIAHNVQIGENTAIAGCVGIAGSTKVGRNCTLGGGVGLSGHLEFGDNLHFTGMSLVTRSLPGPGVYSGNLPAMTNREWRKLIAQLRHLDETTKRMRALERRLPDPAPQGHAGGETQ
jgi:UDP-3-O-[3-hydroxymyristoyl] glucosamine N-acyltransferase